jgi:hypothetical protein
MRGILKSSVASVAVLLVAACSDTTTSPRDATTRVNSPAGKPTLTVSPSVYFSGFRTTTFTLSAGGTKVTIGDGLYTLIFPGNSVCDPAVSSYGPGTWDDDCETLNKPITVTATYGFTSAGLVVDFSPALRFNPGKEVRIGTSIYAADLIANAATFAADPSLIGQLGIYYEPDLFSPAKTDAAFDKSLTTHVNLTTGMVWRRIKHFSGYNVSTGLPCEPGPNDPDCVENPPILEGEM